MKRSVRRGNVEAPDTVLEVLGRHVSPGEIAKVRQALPQALLQMWPVHAL